ncbi:unnamed protein product [Soboliphyme baturini]|uniref:VWFA domain-containing protein n=1 Tax=Soboliphyme baturini TaxID=241478 RepID=A0A183IKT0_9BILA|nr:unnamed protein product [Soboliphyme baturini]
MSKGEEPFLVDLAIVLDSSMTIGRSGFENEKTFVEQLASRFVIRPDRVRIALLQFSEQKKMNPVGAQLLARLKEINNEVVLIACLRTIHYTVNHQSSDCACFHYVILSHPSWICDETPKFGQQHGSFPNSVYFRIPFDGGRHFGGTPWHSERRCGHVRASRRASSDSGYHVSIYVSLDASNRHIDDSRSNFGRGMRITDHTYSYKETIGAAAAESEQESSTLLGDSKNVSQTKNRVNRKNGLAMMLIESSLIFTNVTEMLVRKRTWQKEIETSVAESPLTHGLRSSRTPRIACRYDDDDISDAFLDVIEGQGQRAKARSSGECSSGSSAAVRESQECRRVQLDSFQTWTTSSHPCVGHRTMLFPDTRPTMRMLIGGCIMFLIASIVALEGNPCERQPFKAYCPADSSGKTSRSTFVLRYYKKGSQCVSYPYGYCKHGETIQLFRYKNDCEKHCPNQSRSLVWWALPTD